MRAHQRGRTNKNAIFVAINQQSNVMAKGNIFLGMGRGSVGDVTFYRADGKQLSRVRNRNPRNPKSQAQIYQRAILATVVKAYQAGKAIFDHSFQGYSVGSQCQRQFMSHNTKMLRQLIATDINTPIATNEQKARVVAPGVSVPVANPFVISRGSYQQYLFNFDTVSFGYKIAQKEFGEAVAQYAERMNLIAGDIYTFVVFAERMDMAYVSPHFDDALASLNYCNFGWVRMIVKDGLSSDGDELLTYDQLFNFQSSGGDFDINLSGISTLSIAGSVRIPQLLSGSADGYTDTGAIGLIRSRLDMDLRSDSVMMVNYGNNADTMFGIASAYILDEWSGGTTSVGNSELILEGGGV